MTIQLPALKKLAAKIVRAEVERRSPVDIEFVAEYVARHVDMDGSGELIAVDEAGVPRFGPAPDYATTMSVGELLDEIEAERPALFGKSAITDAQDNPFVKGPGFSMTQQMIMWRTDPERAEYLASEARLSIR